MIFVTGCARSGTSLITQLLAAHGCWLGKENRVNRLFENIDVREKVLKRYLRRIGADPLGQVVLPDTNHLPMPENLRQKVMDCIKGHEPWGYKDAKLTLVWPIFAHAFPEAQWILVRRDKKKIAESCMRTDFMRGFNGKDAWERWVEAHEHRFDGMRENLNVHEVWTDDIVENPDVFFDVTDFCGLRFNPQTTKDIINRDAWHPV